MEQEKKKRKATPAQLENLRKGFQALQAKRKALAEKDSEPVPPPPAPEPVPTPAPAPEPVPVPVPTPPPDAPPKERKKREKKPAFNPDEFRNSLLADLRSGQTERIIEKPVDRIVEKEKVVFKDRVVSGSELLNRIFGFD
jgi:hypothetical protein